MRCDRCGTQAELIQVSIAKLEQFQPQGILDGGAEVVDLCGDCVDSARDVWNAFASQQPVITLPASPADAD